MRGKGPLQPRVGEKLNFAKNQSPLAKLFYGFRKSHPPGLRNLIPGTKTGQGLYTEAKRWADLFYAGDFEYQSDEKWYENVLNAEFPEDDSTFDPTNTTKPTTVTPFSISGITHVEDGEDIYHEVFPGKKELIMEQQYDLQSLLNQMPYHITVYNYWPKNHHDSPIIFEAMQASRFKVYVNNHHQLFKDFADGWEDLIIMEIATRYYEKINDLDIWPVSRIYYELKRKYLGDKMLNIQSLITKAKSLITDLQSFLVNEFGDEKLDPIPVLSADEIKVLKQTYLQIESKSLSNVESIIQTTQFLKYMDFAYIIHFANLYPDLIYDEKYFALPYSFVDEDDVKERQLEQYSGYLNDIKWFIYDLANYTDILIKQQKNLIIRNRYSLEFLNGKLA